VPHRPHHGGSGDNSSTGSVVLLISAVLVLCIAVGFLVWTYKKYYDSFAVMLLFQTCQPCCNGDGSPMKLRVKGRPTPRLSGEITSMQPSPRSSSEPITICGPTGAPERVILNSSMIRREVTARKAAMQGLDPIEKQRQLSRMADQWHPDNNPILTDVAEEVVRLLEMDERSNME